MRPLDAVRAGYDELTHINFVMMQAMPQDVVDHSNGIARHLGMAQYAPDVNIHSPEFTAYLDELQRRHIAVDPTLVTFELEYVAGFGRHLGGLCAVHRHHAADRGARLPLRRFAADAASLASNACAKRRPRFPPWSANSIAAT